MMRIRRVWVVFMIAVLFHFGGLLNVQSEAQENEQDSYKQKIEKILNDFEKKIKELDRKGVKVKAEAKAEYKEAMKDLRVKETAAKKKWMELKKVSARGWDKAHSEMGTAIRSLEDSYKRTASWFKGRNGTD